MPPPELVDDPSISNDEILWRRISPEDIKPDSVTGILRPTSGAFRTIYMSVNRASLTTPENVLADFSTHRLVAFTAGFVRSIGCIVISDPVPDPSHALVCAKNPSTRLNKTQARQFANQAPFVDLSSFNLPGS